MREFLQKFGKKNILLVLLALLLVLQVVLALTVKDKVTGEDDSDPAFPSPPSASEQTGSDDWEDNFPGSADTTTDPAVPQEPTVTETAVTEPTGPVDPNQYAVITANSVSFRRPA